MGIAKLLVLKKIIVAAEDYGKATEIKDAETLSRNNIGAIVANGTAKWLKECRRPKWVLHHTPGRPYRLRRGQLALVPAAPLRLERGVGLLEDRVVCVFCSRKIRRSAADCGRGANHEYS